MVSMHGISPHGYTLDECRVVLFRHVFGGDCVSPYVRSHHNDRTACIYFSKGFQSEEEMSFSAFRIIASAKCSQRSNDELLSLLRDLDIHTDFHVQHTRCPIWTAPNISDYKWIWFPRIHIFICYRWTESQQSSYILSNLSKNLKKCIEAIAQQLAKFWPGYHRSPGDLGVHWLRARLKKRIYKRLPYSKLFHRYAIYTTSDDLGVSITYIYFYFHCNSR